MVLLRCYECEKIRGFKTARNICECGGNLCGRWLYKSNRDGSVWLWATAVGESIVYSVHNFLGMMVRDGLTQQEADKIAQGF